MKIMITIISCFFFTNSLLAAEARDTKTSFQKICSQCHKLPQTGHRTVKQWDIIFGVMQKIMTNRGIALPSKDEEQQILQHLKQNAKKSNQTKTSDTEDLFIARCTLCHQLPEPGMLKPVQWKIIVHTMQQRMKQVNVPQLSDQERQQILGYLAEQAQK